MGDYHFFTLPNGLRFIHSRNEGRVSYAGVIIGAGSRNEDIRHQGLAHFVEHTIFKGTQSRKSWHISNRMESVGGELNAYTSKEETVIYTNSPSGFEERSFDLISDLIGRCTFPAAEIEREREVVIEEINSYLDSPGELVFDEFEDRIYKGSHLGHNILGNPDSVKEIKSTDCREFIDDFYTPGNMVVYCMDNLSHAKTERLAAKYFSYLHFPKKCENRHLPVEIPVFNERLERDGHQAHTIVGTRLFGRNDPRRFALFLLNNYLGGPCMNSRLNQELRERRGYVYAVDSVISLLSDCGSMMIYMGSDSDKVDKCMKLVFHEIEKLAENTMKPGLFEKIKRQYAGQLLVSSDNKESVAMSLGKSILYYDEIHDIESMTQNIQEVTAPQLRETAELIVPEKMSVLTLF